MEVKNNDRIHVINMEDIETVFDFITIPKYGSITIIIHDGKVVQIEKNEKFRLP